MEVRETTVSEADVRLPTHFERRVWASWLGCEIARAAPENEFDEIDAHIFVGERMLGYLCRLIDRKSNKPRWDNSLEDATWKEYKSIVHCMAGGTTAIFKRLGITGFSDLSDYFSRAHTDLIVVSRITYYLLAMANSEYKDISLGRAKYLADHQLSRQRRNQKADHKSASTLDRAWKRFGKVCHLAFALPSNRTHVKTLFSLFSLPRQPRGIRVEKILAIAQDARSRLADVKVLRGDGDLEKVLQSTEFGEPQSCPLYSKMNHFRMAIERESNSLQPPTLSQSDMVLLRGYSAGRKKSSGD